jgi:hypothetical protein
VIEKMKNDFFVVHLCPPGTELPEGKLHMDEMPKHGVEHGPSSGAGRRRKTSTKKSGKGLNATRTGTNRDMYGLPDSPDGRHATTAQLAAQNADGIEGDVVATGANGYNPVARAMFDAQPIKAEDAPALLTKVEPAEDGKSEVPSVKLEDPSSAMDVESKEESGDVAGKESGDGGSKKLQFWDKQQVNDILDAYLTTGPMPDLALMEDTADPDGLQSTPFVDSRHTFLEMCQWRHYQFDTLRRAKYASLMSLYHLHNCTPSDNKAHAAHCNECGKQIKGVRWHCSVCPDFELCTDCNTHDPNSANVHPHLLTPYRVSYEGELRA